jgi:flavin-dependent dehydrogenase
MRWGLPSRRSLAAQLARRGEEDTGRLELVDGSRIAVIGGGPAGSLFTYFVFKMAEVLDLELTVDVFEPRTFTRCGPAGCNHCGGIVSESLVQLLATEGINLPPRVVQRGLDSYLLHMDVGSVRIDTPLQEQRIAAVFRGNGPRDARHVDWDSFDDFLLRLAVSRGANIVRRVVTGIDWSDDRPVPIHDGERAEPYDLVAVAAGINSNLLRTIETESSAYRRPTSVATYLCEFQLNRETVQRHLGSSMHVFLLDLPHLEFAALVPKGNVVTMCLLGDEIDMDLVRAFLDSAEVRACFPPGTDLPAKVCNCSPLINVRGPARPYADRLVFVGDSGVTRLYKDGIGAAYRTAKAAASTVVFQGVSKAAFDRHYHRTCRRISRDNAIGKFIFAFNGQIQRRRFSRRAILRMVSEEQASPGAQRYLSRVLWDLFTGSAPYREVLLNTMRPGFIRGILRHTLRSILPFEGRPVIEGKFHGRDRTG